MNDNKISDEALQAAKQATYAFVLSYRELILNKQESAALSMMLTSISLVAASWKGEARKIIKDQIDNIFSSIGDLSFEDLQDLESVLGNSLNETEKE